VKGAVATGLGLAIFGNAAAFWCAAAAVLGHVYPITRRFAGGKGVATASGAMLVVHPFISIGLLLLWAVLSKTTKKASISSLVITVLLPICIAVAGAPGWEIAATVGIGVLVVIRHIPNLRRLRSGLEPSLPSKPT
jgi:glycerol-3-phosphate acyltransferase PlsY